MKRKQKRYTCELDVLSEIHSAQRKVNKLLKEAEEKDALAKVYFIGGDGETGRIHKDKAQEIRDKVKKIETVKLERLKQTLSTLQTTTFNFIKDNSIPLQKL